MNVKCSGCGVELEPGESQGDAAAGEVLITPMSVPKKTDRVCSACSSANQRKTSVIYLLLWACLVLLAVWVMQHDLLPYMGKTRLPAYSDGKVPAPRLTGNFPCVSATVTSGGVSPHFGNCAIRAMNGGAVDGFEADFRDGNFVMQQTDLEVKDVFDVALTRSYRSNFWEAGGHAMAFGINSNDSYDVAPLGTRNPYTYQILVLGDGEFLYFDRITKGTSYSDAEYMHTETASPYYQATQRWNGDGWTMQLPSGLKIVFPDSFSAKDLAQGGPTEMIDAKGNRLQLVRDGNRNLDEIKTPHGHWIRLWYDGELRIERAQADAGQWAEYQYNEDGLLADAKFSNGHERRYDYDGKLMTRVTDESGHVLVANEYSQGLLSRQQFEGGAVYSYGYDWAPKSLYPNDVWVRLPNKTTRDVPVADSVSEFLLDRQR